MGQYFLDILYELFLILLFKNVFWIQIRLLRLNLDPNTNEEKIFTKTRSKAVSKDIVIDADTFEYDKKLNTATHKPLVEKLYDMKSKLNWDDLKYFFGHQSRIHHFQLVCHPEMVCGMLWT